MRSIVLAVAVATLVPIGVGHAAPERRVSNFVLQLTPSEVVPAPKTAPRGATGTAVVRLSTAADVDLRRFNLGSQWRLIVHLTFSNLTSQAIRVHIHTGRRGEGPRQGDLPALVLCRRAPCRSPIHTSLAVSGIFVKGMLTHGAYVDVHTQRNPGGELRGRFGWAKLTGQR